MINLFSIKELEPLSNFLGIRIRRDKFGMYLDQLNYTKKQQEHFRMDKCKPHTPMETQSSTIQTNQNADVGEPNPEQRTENRLST